MQFFSYLTVTYLFTRNVNKSLEHAFKFTKLVVARSQTFETQNLNK